MGTIQPQWPSFHQLRTLADKVRALQQSGGYPLAMTARELVSKEPSIPSEIRRRVAIAVAKMADGRTQRPAIAQLSGRTIRRYAQR